MRGHQDVKQRKFIVSGTSRGIGFAIARSLLTAGHSVIGVSRSAAVELLDNGDFIHVQVDLTDGSAIERSIRQLLREQADISGLVNNAGAGFFGSLEEFSFRRSKAPCR